MVSKITLIILALLVAVVSVGQVVVVYTHSTTIQSLPISVIGYRTLIAEDTSLVRIVIAITPETKWDDDVKAVRDLANQSFKRNKSALITICEQVYGGAFPDALECPYTFLFVPNPSTLWMSQKQ